jgi:hypothetical protein
MPKIETQSQPDQPLRGWDLALYCQRHEQKGRRRKPAPPHAVWLRQGARVASQRCPILPGGLSIVAQTIITGKCFVEGTLSKKDQAWAGTVLSKAL